MLNKYKLKHLLDNSLTLSGVYNGVVVDTSDPGVKSNGAPVGRVRVSIPGLTEGIAIDDLPWYSGKQAFDSSPDAKAKIPPVGSEVVVEFPNNDIYNGLVSYVMISSPPN